MKNAQMAESFVVVFGGATSMLLKGRGSLQALMRPHCKRCFSFKRVKDIEPTVREALFLAKDGVSGARLHRDDARDHLAQGQHRDVCVEPLPRCGDG